MVYVNEDICYINLKNRVHKKFSLLYDMLCLYEQISNDLFGQSFHLKTLIASAF